MVVAVLTFRRPGDLQQIVPLVVEQLRAVARAVAGSVLVVDNDPAGSAAAPLETIVASLGETDRAAVTYIHEPTPGIAAARNRALVEGGSADLLVFIDDDERPSVNWLASLIEVQRATGAAAVAGPVVSEYEVRPGRWITAGRYFERRSLPDRTPIAVAATNNLLLDLGRVRHWGLSFDTALGVTGGEDTLFTREILNRGGTMFWAAGAGVVDVVPRARTTKRWVVLRAFSSGNSWSLTTLMLTHGRLGTLRAKLGLTARGSVRAAGGVAQILVGIALGRLSHRARGTRTLARGAGMVSGAWGYTYREYRRG
ncbi:hypothetical protein B7R25_07385 [Subtercola boreus]|uniref:Glycosyltransferase 2-like domain-containing protein n=1 Tax=Subtercola boreus TaxID=120213 RepID=A0A3E0WBE6_9MICO|nr:hypothetical protein B7R24_07315 [Subtercola boreus]RFA21746.1 hypothetical protein B7R23_07260 [Subtercola boreus]RFA27717.1 hypothetical protein B7R25_07385 [Subtercola boreus]